MSGCVVLKTLSGCRVACKNDMILKKKSSTLCSFQKKNLSLQRNNNNYLSTKNTNHETIS